MSEEKKEIKLEEDIRERVENFIKEINPLLKKYELGIIATPEFTQDGRITAKPLFISSRKPKEEPKEKSKKVLSE